MRRYGWMLAGVMVALAAGPVHAQWKWKDAKGQVHVSDLPPPGDVADKDVLQRPAARAPQRPGAPTPAPATVTSAAPMSTAAPGATAKPKVDPELEARKKKVEQEQAAKDDAEAQKQAAARAENCTRAKGNLNSLESGVRIARTNDKGEREFLDDKQRNDEIARTRQVIATECR